MRSLAKKISIPVRNKVQTRPWQHVLEPLHGYLKLAEKISFCRQSDNRSDLSILCSAFNFGPNISSNKTVKNLVEEIIKHWQGNWVDVSDPNAVHEAGKLNLSSDKAYHLLGWRPRWCFEDTVKQTVEWYQNYNKLLSDGKLENAAVIDITRSQIKLYEATPPLP
jgi:CDP-glucose 4,6-dehydratase